jgi:hypothetical protein
MKYATSGASIFEKEKGKGVRKGVKKEKGVSLRI